MKTRSLKASDPGKKGFIILRSGITNDYLVKIKQGFLLIDTGCEKYYRRFLFNLKRIGVDLSEIRYLLLTHHHHDHSGFVSRLRADHEDLSLIVQRPALELLKSGINDLSHGGGYLNKMVFFLFLLFRSLHPGGAFEFEPVSLRDTDIVIDGDDESFLEQIGIKGKILYTPGHSLDSMCILLDDGTVFCGDTAMNGLVLSWTKYHPVIVTDLGALYQSWEKLLRNGAKILFPSHGRLFEAGKLRENMGKFDSKSLVKFR